MTTLSHALSLNSSILFNKALKCIHLLQLGKYINTQERLDEIHGLGLYNMLTWDPSLDNAALVLDNASCTRYRKQHYDDIGYDDQSVDNDTSFGHTGF